MKLIRCTKVTDGMNTKSGLPFKFKNQKANLSWNLRYKSENGIPIFSMWKECEIIQGEWFKFEYYITLLIKNENQTTICYFTGDSLFNDILLYIKTKNIFNILTNVFAWVGGILGIILTIIQIINI